jgi:hypothetical protein
MLFDLELVGAPVKYPRKPADVLSVQLVSARVPSSPSSFP